MTSPAPSGSTGPAATPVAGPSKPIPKPVNKLAPPPKVNPFVYLGIPQAVFDYRPKLPGRKMSIFLSVTISLTSAYIYDRRECKRLQQEYIDTVKWMSEAPLGSGEQVRKIKVYGARIPEDGELERSSKWFKKYMKPILVASGTDYVLKTGTNPGGLGRTLINEIRARRILKASQAATSPVSAYNSAGANMTSVLSQRDDDDERLEQTEGGSGIVILGRTALKEYLWALRKGFGEPIDLREEARLEGLGLGANSKRKDGRWEREEELMVRELDKEEKEKNLSPFDVPLPAALEGIEGNDIESSEATVTAGSSTPNFLPFTPYRAISPQSAPVSDSTPIILDEAKILPPVEVPPPQPPLLLVPFSHAFGFRSWPSKWLHFFNKRSDVKLGGDAALTIIAGTARSFEPPTLKRAGTNELQGLLDDNLVNEVRVGEHKDLQCEEGELTGSKDLDFLAESDEFPTHFRKSYRSLPSAHEYSRRTYYTTDLPPRLATAREINSGTRPMTKAEEKYPPKMESELRKERLDKELRWRRELEGWAVVRSGSGIAWREEWGMGQGSETPFKVYQFLSDDEKNRLREERTRWETEKAKREQERENFCRERDSTKMLHDEE